MKTPLFAATVLVSFAFAGAAAADTVTPIADVERGTNVTVSGTVERLLDSDEFRLADDSGSIRVYVGPDWVPADVGEAVTVRGFVDDDWFNEEIYAREIERADGTITRFDHRYE